PTCEGNQNLLAFNRADGAITSRQPAPAFTPSPDTLGTGWRTPTSPKNIASTIPTAKTLWHAIVSRRTRDVHDASHNAIQDASDPVKPATTARAPSPWPIGRSIATPAPPPRASWAPCPPAPKPPSTPSRSSRVS